MIKYWNYFFNSPKIILKTILCLERFTFKMQINTIILVENIFRRYVIKIINQLNKAGTCNHIW